MLPCARWCVIKRNHIVCVLVEFTAQMGRLTLNKQTQTCIYLQNLVLNKEQGEMTKVDQ